MASNATKLSPSNLKKKKQWHNMKYKHRKKLKIIYMCTMKDAENDVWYKNLIQLHFYFHTNSVFLYKTLYTCICAYIQVCLHLCLCRERDRQTEMMVSLVGFTLGLKKMIQSMREVPENEGMQLKTLELKPFPFLVLRFKVWQEKMEEREQHFLLLAHCSKTIR